MANSLRLLIIEGKDDDALLEVEELREWGFDPDFQRVDTAEDLEAALQAGPWDAILADDNMPSFTGLDALRIVRSYEIDIPFVLVSGMIGEERAVEAMKSGVNDYIMKGNLARLAPAIERELREATVRRERRQALNFSAQLEQKVAERTAALSAEIEERKRAEKTVQQQRQFLEKAIESLAHPFYVIDAHDRTILLANSASGFGVTPSETTCHALTHKQDQPCNGASCPCPLDIMKKTRERVTAEHSHYDSDGNPRCCEIHGYPVLDDAGNLVQMIAYTLDISERKQAEAERKKLEEQLHHAQKMEALGTLVGGGIAHDFNNILTAIIGFGSLIQMDTDKADPRAHHLDEILRAADRAINLTRSLLTFGRKQVIEARPVNLNGIIRDVNEIIREVEKMLTRLLREDIELKTSLAEGNLMVMADRGLIQQVLMNLATNARDAMQGGGTLTIDTMAFEMDEAFDKTYGYGKAGEYALIMVSYSEPFSTTKEVGKGTGLGLSACYGIIKQHRGYINCYSEPGRGTTFRIYLPRIDAVEKEAKSVPPAPPLGGNETILLAEDDAQVRIVTRMTLETFGYEVIEAADGEEAIVRFMEHENEIKLIILDVIMPKMNGKDAYDEIRKLRPGAMALFTSGYPADVFHQEDVVENGFHFIAKPATPTELLRKVRGLLDG